MAANIYIYNSTFFFFSKQYPDYHYNLVMKHKSTSNQLAHDTKIRFFLPDYVEFVSMISGSDNRLTQKQFGGSRLFEVVCFEVI